MTAPADRTVLDALTRWESAWRGLRVVVLGIGKSGFSAADTLAELGARVVVVAESDDEQSQAAAETLSIVGVESVRLGWQDGQGLLSAAQCRAWEGQAPQLVVSSPGFPPWHPLLELAQRQGIPIWGDLELAWRLRRREGKATPQWVTVTGTNGKTTTTIMVAEMLRAAGLKVGTAGNIGIPMLDRLREPEEYDVFVVELSSFQLRWMMSVAAEVSLCLNVAEDHLDWHGSMEAYVADKAKIYERTRRVCVYNADDDSTEHMVAAAEVQEGCRAVGFTTGSPEVGMVGIVEGLVVDRAFHPQRRTHAVELAHVADIADMVPRHLAANAVAAATVARALEVPAHAVREGLQAFDLGEHRMQPIAQSDDIVWVNDSKATNPHAAAASLAAFASVVWIAGGDAKGMRYEELVRTHAGRLRAVVLLGREHSALQAALAQYAPDAVVQEIPRQAKDPQALMSAAVHTAFAQARPGDTVLLAPAASSLDQFASYAHRGRAFIEAVRELLETSFDRKG